jgi:hypothetical protein
MTLCRNPAHSRSKSTTKKQSKFQFLPLFSIKAQTPDYQSQTNRVSSVGAFSFPQLAHFHFLSWQKTPAKTNCFGQSLRHPIGTT